MRSRLFLLVGSIAALGVACGDNGTAETPDARRNIDARPGIDAVPAIDSRPPAIDAPPDARPVITVDARPPIDAAFLIDAPPTLSCPNGNAAECSATAGGICASNNEFAVCVEYDTTNHCFSVMPMGCPLHQSCTTPGARGVLEALCTCDGSRCNGETGNVCLADNTGFVTCASETNAGETCFFETAGSVCTPPRSCGDNGADQGCICPADSATAVENGGCAGVGAGATACGVDVANKAAVMVCTIEPSGCRIWKVQLGCDALGLTCNQATTACECAANTTGTVYANPVPEARAGFEGTSACQVENSNCNPHPTGLRVPSYCSFATLTEAIAEAGNTGTVVASRFVTAAGGDSPNPAVFDAETFPLNGAGGGGLVLTTTDDAVVGGPGVSLANADHFQIVFNDANGDDEQAVELGADDFIRGYRITNDGLGGGVENGTRAINCSGSGTGARVNSVRVDATDGGNVLAFGIVANTGCTGTFQHVKVNGGATGIFTIGTVTIDDATIDAAGTGINVSNTATVTGSTVSNSGSLGISVRDHLIASSTNVTGGATCVRTGADGMAGTVDWTGGSANGCTAAGFAVLADGGNVTINGPTTINGNGEGISLLVNATATLHGVTISNSTSNGVHVVNNGSVTANGAATTIMTSMGAGSGILLSADGTANLSNTTIMSSGAAGVSVLGTSDLVLGAGTVVTTSGTSGVVLTGTGTVTANAGSSITMNLGTPGHGIAASGGTVTLNASSISANAGNGVDLSGAATLTSTGSTITTNADGIHSTGTGNISVTGGVVGGAGTAVGNNEVGVHIEGTSTNTLTNVTVNNNGSSGLLQAEAATKPGGGQGVPPPAAPLTNATDTTFDNNGASGVVVLSGRANLVNGSADGNTGGVPVVGAPVSAGVAVGIGATVTIRGSSSTSLISVSGNDIGIVSAGNFAGLNVSVADNTTQGVVVVTADAPAFPEAGGGLFGAATTNLHNAWLRNIVVSNNGKAPKLGLTPGGVSVLKTRAAALPGATAASNFALYRDQIIPNSVSFVHDNGGNGVTLGAPASGATCPTLAALGLSCGPVDALVDSVYIARNDLNGILIQGGGNNGSTSAVHLSSNLVYSNKAQGIFFRPSVLVSGVTSGGTLAKPVSQNIVKGNVTAPPTGSIIAETGEMEFDGTQFAGGPVPATPFTWVIESDPAVVQCASTANTLGGYRVECVNPAHKGLILRNNAQVTAFKQIWPSTTINNLLDFFIIASPPGQDFQPVCQADTSGCTLPADPL